MLVITLPLWLILAPIRPSQPDTFLNLLPNAFYLVDYGRLPTAGLPPSGSLLPAAPYNTQFLSFLGSLLYPDYPAAGMSLVNLLLQLTAALAIARALVNDPKLILADEPTGALDSRTSVEVMDIFQRLNRERGITLVLVTHEPDIAAYADRVVVFKDGRIQKDYRVTAPRDAAEELRNLPAVDDEDEEEG